MYLRGKGCRYCLAQEFFSGSDLARVWCTDAGGNGVKSEAISTPFLLAGGKVLRLRRDLIRITEENRLPP